MKKMRFFLAVLTALISNLAFAQNLTVTGTVKDSSTGEPVPFAAIQLKGTMTGGMSDGDGVFSIDVPADGVLIFSSVGYKELEVLVAGKAKHDVLMDPDTETIEETIVVAFGTATKESFTGSATVVKSSDIQKTQSSDVTRALEGMVAGVQMTTPSGSLGSSPSIMIRGISSITAGTAPLYVVDGVPYSGDMNNLNAADIESMTVLKDAASNALYGARGANGVIMITTKKAKLGEAKINIDAKWGINTKALESYDYITDPGLYYQTHYNALYNYYCYEQGMSPEEANLKAATNLTGPATNGGLGYLTFDVPEGQRLIGTNGKLNPNATPGRIVNYKGERYLLQPDDWMKEAYKTSLRQEYNVSVAGTTGNAQIFASFGYLNNKGIIDGEDMQRYTARIRTDYQAKEWLKIGMNAGLSRPINGNMNALRTVTLDTNNSEGNAINGTGYAEVKFLQDFKFTFNAGIGVDETRSTTISNMYYGQFAANGGIIGKSHGRSFYLNLQQLLNWDKTFNFKHHVSVLFGHEWYKSTGVSLGAQKSKMFSLANTELGGAVIDMQSASSGYSQYNNEGYFLRAQYDYENRIFASASFRRDASSRFHPDHRWGNFWSVGGGWLINSEPWFRLPWVNMLKLKASIGSQGNDNISDLLYTDMYAITNSDGEIGIKRGQIGNPDITWETNTNFNAGFDFDLLRGRLSGSVEYFYRLTSDMLYFVTIPISYGFSGYYDNIGDMRNAGIEFALNGAVMDRRNFRWDAYINMTHYTNKIIMLPDTHKNRDIEGYKGYASGNKYVGEGLPLNTFLMPKYAGIDKTNGLPLYYKDVQDENGNVIGKTLTSEYSEATDYLCDDPTPKLYGGFGTSFSFYGFDISASFTYSIGGLSYDSGYANFLEAPGGTVGKNFHKDVLNAWSPSNPDSDQPRFFYGDTDLSINGSSDRFLVDASYLNFQNAQIGYTFSPDVTRKIKVDKIRVYATCDNIVYWSRRHGFDPRTSFSGGTSYEGNSPVRTISFGLNLMF